MTYGHVSSASDPRVIEVFFNHLGTDQLRRSSLADANRKRSPEPFATLDTR